MTSCQKCPTGVKIVKGYLITAQYWIYSDNTPTTQVQMAEEIWVCPQFHKCNSPKIPGQCWNKTLTQRGRRKLLANVALDNIDNCVANFEWQIFFRGIFVRPEVEMDLLLSQLEPDHIIMLLKTFRCISCTTAPPTPPPTSRNEQWLNLAVRVTNASAAGTVYPS